LIISPFRNLHVAGPFDGSDRDGRACVALSGDSVDRIWLSLDREGWQGLVGTEQCRGFLEQDSVCIVLGCT
jgi:hypothetical protein